MRVRGTNPLRIVRERRLEVLLVAICLLRGGSVHALDQSVSRIGGDVARELLGDGTGVVVAVVDSGVDETHPALAGLDSLGQPRMVAGFNSVPTEPNNTGDDLHGHGTGVAGVILSHDAKNMGLAPDARFLNARALDADNNFDTGSWIENGTGWAIDQGADVLNLSLNYYSTGDTSSAGNFDLDRLLDWAAFAPDHQVTSAVCVGNIEDGAGRLTTPRSPAGSFNVLTVGHTGPSNYDRLHNDSAYGPTSDGRSKPDIVAPGQGITTASASWETGGDFTNWTGCSFATPHVAGVLTQLIDYGQTNALSTAPSLLKAVLLNSADKTVLNRSREPWAAGSAELSNGVLEITSPLDPQTGAGQVNAIAAAHQYRSADQSPGDVSPIGWNLNSISGENSNDYDLEIQPAVGTTLTTTLTWLRHVERFDNGNAQIDAADSYSTSGEGNALDNLDLLLLRDGEVVARSISTVDNVEHIHWEIEQAGDYRIRVNRQFTPNAGNDEDYALAWYVAGFLGDFNADGLLQVNDIEALTTEVLQNTNDPLYDVNQDGFVDQADRTFWVEQIAFTYFGDADLNGLFNTSDLTLVFQAGEYEDDAIGNSTWSTGDWDGDREFATGDLVTAFQAAGFESGPRQSVRAIPEPNTASLLLIATACILSSRTNRARRNKSASKDSQSD